MTNVREKHSLFITSFRNLKVLGDTGPAFELLPNINLTNDAQTKRELLAFPSLRSTIGQIEYDHLAQHDTIVYGHFEPADFKNLDTHTFLLIVLLWIKTLFRSAWLWKDHCFHCDGAFLLRKNQPGELQCSGNFLAQRTLLANGEGEHVEFTIDELEEWQAIHDRVETYLWEKESHDLRFSMERGYCRSGRAFQFLEDARTSTNLAMRIAHSCSAFETLFSTDAAELSHKLAERVAFFLGEFGLNKLEVFRNLKTAYGVRSKLTHGDVLKDKAIRDLPIISSVCDQYLRTTFNALFAENMLVRRFDGESNTIDEIFHSLIFSSKTFRE